MEKVLAIIFSFIVLFVVKYFLDDYPEVEISWRLAATFHISKIKTDWDYHELLQKIDLLINRADICPVTF